MIRVAHARVPTWIFDEPAHAERTLCDELKTLLASAVPRVLGLATGKTMLGVYRELVAAQRSGALSFAAATSFNLDEFLGLPADHPASFREWMRRHFPLAGGLDPERAHFPAPQSANETPDEAAARFEREIAAAGGIDLTVLGIGRNGHIGFNEPGSPRASRTRIVELAETTRADLAPSFGGSEHVPQRALTMGVATLLDSRRLRVLAFGPEKAEIVRRTLHDPISSALPATFLAEHGDVCLYVDRAAARWIG